MRNHLHLDRLLSILDMISVAGRPLSAIEVQKATGLPRPTCYRLLQNLLSQGLVDDPDGDARYVIGKRLVRMALLGTSDLDVARACTPSLKTAAAAFGEAVFLARFRNEQVEIIQVETPADTTRGFIHPGVGVRPMHACSCSKAIASFAQDSFREQILRGPLKAYTDTTKATQAALRAEFAKIRKQGFAECDQEVEIGASSVAAPVHIGHIGASFSIGTVGPSRRFTATHRRKLGEELKRISDKVSAAIQLCNVAQIAEDDRLLLKPLQQEGPAPHRQH